MKYLVAFVFVLLAVAAEENFETLMQWGRESATKHPQEAIKFYERIQNSPQFDPAQKSAALLQAVRCSILANQLEKSVEFMQQLLSDSSSHTEALLKAVDDLSEARSLLALRNEMPTHPGLADIHTKLDTNIINRIILEEVPVRAAFRVLREKSKAADPTGEGVQFYLFLGQYPIMNMNDILLDDHEDLFASEDEKDAFGKDPLGEETETDNTYRPPTVYMDFDNIPLGEAVRYICEQVGLRYEITNRGVEIRGPSLEQKGFELKIIHMDARDLLDCSQTPTIQEIRKYFEDCGVSFPQTSWGQKATIRYNSKAKVLIAVNTSENNRLLERITKVLYHEPQNVQLSVRIFEISLPANHLEPPLFTVPLLSAIPETHKRCVAEVTGTAVAGQKLKVDSSATSDGIRREFTLESLPTIQHGLELSFPFELSFRQWSKDGQNQPTLEINQKSQLRLWDGNTAVINLSCNSADKLQRVMVLTPRILDSSGLPQNETTNAGNLDEALRVLLGPDYAKKYVEEAYDEEIP